MRFKYRNTWHCGQSCVESRELWVYIAALLWILLIMALIKLYFSDYPVSEWWLLGCFPCKCWCLDHWNGAWIVWLPASLRRLWGIWFGTCTVTNDEHLYAVKKASEDLGWLKTPLFWNWEVTQAYKIWLLTCLCTLLTNWHLMRVGILAWNQGPGRACRRAGYLGGVWPPCFRHYRMVVNERRKGLGGSKSIWPEVTEVSKGQMVVEIRGWGEFACLSTLT